MKKLMTYRIRAAKPHSLMTGLLTTVLAVAVSTAHASGGLDAGKQGLSTFQIWLYACAGILAACYLIYVGIQCMKGRGDWVHEFGTAVIQVFALGGAVAVAGWAFSAGGS